MPLPVAKAASAKCPERRLTCLLTRRSQRTGNLSRLYTLRRAQRASGARYCVVRFADRERCRDVRMVGVGASIGQGP